MESDIIRVAVVEDHTLVREGLVTMLDSHDNIDVIVSSGDGAVAYEQILEALPDVVLLDLRLPGMDGLEVLKRLKTKVPAIRVLVLTVHDEQNYVSEAVIAGADGYLLKTVSHAELSDAVKRVHSGEAVLHPAVARQVLTELSQGSAGHSADGGLSVREREILMHLAQGLSNKQIASEISVGVETVKTHISSILHKLEAVDRTQAVALALRRGLIE